MSKDTINLLKWNSSNAEISLPSKVTKFLATQDKIETNDDRKTLKETKPKPKPTFNLIKQQRSYYKVFFELLGVNFWISNERKQLG